MNTVPKLRQGMVLGERYQVEAFLGRGGLGEAYLCRDLCEKKAQVVLKILCAASPAPAGIGSLHPEFSYIRRLRHPNLIRIMDFGLLDGAGEPFLVEEYLEGTDLYSGTQNLDAERALGVLIELSKTIQFLHTRGIIHGNIKPSNAFLTGGERERGGLKLLDFGLARWLRSGQEGSGLGMLAYSAPEVLMGERVNVKSDLYSLGILIYQVLARRLPFEDEDPGFLVQKQLQGSVDLRPIERLKGGAGLSQLVRELLEKDQAKRPSSMEEVMHLLSDSAGLDYSRIDERGIEGQFSAAQFIGREREMLFLKERAGSVREGGRGWTVYITGEAGSGKTRCMEEMRIWALLERWRVVEGSCGAREELSYGPYRQILSRTEPAKGEEIFRFGEMSRVAETGTFESSSEFAAGQFRDLLTRELVRRLAEKPTLLLLHDFHRADEATSAVLDYLSSDIQAHPILMCVSLRAGEETKSSLGKVMEQSIRQQRGEVLALEPLAEECVGELVAGMTGDPKLKETLGPWIFKSIGGNPFFVEEMLKHLVEQGLLRRESGGWRFIEEDLRNLEVPASVGVVLQRRLEQLSPSARELANWLALIRRAVSKDLLSLIVSESGLDVSQSLRELSSRQMIQIEMKETEEYIEFRHALISEMIRNDIAIKPRRNMHRKIAGVLERKCGIEGNLEEIAMHHMEGKFGESAVRYALAVAKQARAEFAHESALRCFDYALNDRSGLSKEEICNIAIEASDTLFAIGFPKRAIQLLRREMHNSQTIGVELKAKMFMQLALSYQHLGDLAMQEICCKKGLSLFRNRSGSESNQTKAMLFAELAFGAVLQSHPRRGLAYLSRAIKSCQGLETTALAGRIQSLSASLHRVACNLHDALVASKKAAYILDHSGDSFLICSAYSTLGTVLMGLGRFSLALDRHKQAVVLSDKSRSVVLRSQALGNLAECLSRMGRAREAINAAERAAKSVSESNNPAITHAFNTILAEVRFAANDYRGAFQIVSQLFKESGHNLALYTLGHAHYIAASLYFALGNFEAALEHIEDLCRIETCEAPFYERELAQALRARILLERGMVQKIMGNLLLLDKVVTKKHWPYQMCIIKLNIGEVLIKQQKLETAEKYIRNALRLANAMHSLSLLSHSHLLMGIIYSQGHHKKSLPNNCGRQANALNERYCLERSIEELQASYRIAESCSNYEARWRAHAELCTIYKSVSNTKQCVYHAKKAYEFLCELERRMPVEMRPVFLSAFGRGQVKAELTGIIEEGRELGRDVGVPVVNLRDDDRARILLRVSATVNSIRELNPLLEAILDQLIYAVSVERALVYLRETSTGKLKLAKGRTIRRESLANADAVNMSILEEVCKQGKPFMSANAQGDPRVPREESIASYQLGTLLCAPLKVSGRVVGALYADHSLPVGGLSESTINLFAAFCNLAAIAIDNALAHQQLVKEKTELEQYLHHAREGYTEIVGKSVPVEALRDRIALVAASPLDVLITGESGTGKELVARATYRTGRRKSGKFITVDCGTLSDSLAEAEFFGYRKGAFTGASESRQGLLEAAHGGIIFLDEISNLPFRLQAKLLRVLQEREVRRIGETMPRKIDIQVIAATNKDLLEEMRTGRFRRDLYYRLKAMEVQVPALRERMEDAALLIEWFSAKTAALEGGRSKKFSPEAMELLLRYSYPGNVRELKNIVESSYYSTAGTMIGVDELPPEVRHGSFGEAALETGTADFLYREILEGRGNFEDLVKKPFLKHQFGSSVVKSVLQMALKDTGGRYKDAFARLGITGRRYSVTMQFLKRNRCYLDFRPFRRSNYGRPNKGVN